MEKSRKVLLIFFALIWSRSEAVPNMDLNLGITADVLSLLLGNFNEIPIVYLSDVGNQLNRLVQLSDHQKDCERFLIENTPKTTIKDLTILAQCVVAVTKDSTEELPVSVNSILQTITHLLDHSLISVRFIGSSLSKDFQRKCADLVPVVEEFVASHEPCKKLGSSKECVNEAVADNRVREAAYCLL